MERIDVRTKKIKDGEVIIKENTWAYYVYFLKEGNARVVKNVDGRQVTIGTLIKGDIFGEMSFLGEPMRAFSVIADGDVTVNMIAKGIFMDFFDTLPRDMRTRMYAMANDLTRITDIYSRLIVLFQNMQNSETKIIDAKTFEMEIEKMPEFMRDVAIAIARRYDVAVERLTKLSSQVEEKQLRLVTQYLNLTHN